MAERFVIAHGIRDLLGYFGVPADVGLFVAWALLALILTGAILGVGGIMSYVMRKTMARIQTRIGPNRVGPFGLLQFLADGIKLISKEDIFPARADPWGYRVGPFLMILPIILSFAPLPFAPGIVVSDIRFGLLFVLAVSAVSPIAEMVAGWASNNKYSMYGALRAAALDVAYEIPLVLTALSTVLLVGAMSLNGLNFTDIVTAQDATVWFVVLQPIGVFIFFIAALAKAGIVPSDLAEAESELVSGYLTEYSGMRFGVFFTGVFVNIVLISVLTVLLFFGGWTIPWVTEWFAAKGGAIAIVGVFFGLLVFVSKVAFFVLFVLLTWFTLPRFTPAQFLALGWKVLFPLSILNIVVTLLEIRYVVPVLGGA